jgi:hypothetical protein
LLVRALRVYCRLVTMESVDTIHVISDDEAVCAYVEAAKVENISFSVGVPKSTLTPRSLDQQHRDLLT